MYEVRAHTLVRPHFEWSLWRARNKEAGSNEMIEPTIPAGTVVYVIDFNRYGYFTFAYLHFASASKVMEKLWYDRARFREDANRVNEPEDAIVTAIEPNECA